MPTPLSLTIGPVTLQDFEVPDKHLQSLGGEQVVAIHRFPGGTKSVQALGAFPAPVSWSGIIIGPNAFARTKELDRLRIDGQVQTVQFGPWQWQVVVTKFQATPENAWYVPYSIEMEVISDTSGHAALPPPVSTPEARLTSITQDLGVRAGASSSPLTTAVPAVLPRVSQTAADIQKALYGSGGTIPAITPAQLLTLQSEVAAALAALGVVTSGGPSLVGTTGGALIPNTPYFYRVAPVIAGVEQPACPEVSLSLAVGQTTVSASWQPFSNAASYRVYRGATPGGENVYYTSPTPAFTDFGNPGITGAPVAGSPVLLSSGAQIAEAQSLADRLTLALTLLIGQSVPLAILAVVNPNLAALASAYYGDATLWPRIASANNLLDPQPVGTFPSLRVPH